MGKALTAYLLEESSYQISPPDGRLVYFTNEDHQVKTEGLIKADEVDPKIPYPLLNPLQTLFYKLYNKGNALIASPTSSGKSLIAYIFMRNFEGRLVYTAPTKSLVKEKAIELRTYYGKNVAIRTGDSVIESFKEVKEKVIVCTYEYLAHAMRNSAKWVGELSAVVIDEVHQITKRWVLEEIITACKRKGLPILCLSATLPGVQELADWINASLVIESKWRPVPLHREVRKLIEFEPIRGERTTGSLFSAPSTIRQRGEKIAGRLFSALFSIRQRGEQVILFVPKKDYGWQLLELAKEEKIGIMNKTLPFEVEEEREPEIAFHNADVPKEEREEIEKAFREGRLQTLIATHTLAYGVNLPADRVIIMVEFFRKDRKLQSRPDSLDILQMEGRAGRLGIKDIGFSNLLVYGAKEEDLGQSLQTALKKPFTTAIMKDLEYDALSFFLLLAHMYDGENYENYLSNTYSFKKVSKEKLLKIEEFLRDKEYLQGAGPSKKGLLCIRTGIPPTKFEDFLERVRLDLDPISTIRPLMYMKKFDGLKTFLERIKGFKEDLGVVRAKLLPCGRKCLEDNTDQLLFYVEGLTVKYPNIKNPPGEFSYLGIDALHLLKTLLQINKSGFYRFSTLNLLQIAHSIKHGISPEYASLAGIKGIGHIRANLIKEVLKEANIKPPMLCSPVEELLELLKEQDLWDPLLKKLTQYRKLSSDKAKGEVEKMKGILKNNKKGYMVDDKILLAYALFTEGASAFRKSKKDLVEEVKQFLKEP